MNPVLYHLRRLLFAASALVLGWALTLNWTGGFHLELGGLSISSRNTQTAVEVAVCLALAAVLLVPWSGGLAQLRAEGRWWLRFPERVWRNDRRILPALAILIVVAVVGIHQWLAASPLWLDEETIALNARDRSLGGLTGALWLGQSAPLGWLVLLRAVIQTWGTSEIALRLLPEFFDLALFATAIWIGRQWLGLAGTATLAWFCAFGHWLSHYSFEVKHYSADAWAALLLPALAVWALEGVDSRQRRRRTVVWWAVAAVGLWLANGAVLVTPALAVFVTLALWRKDGWRGACAAVALGLVWVVSFGAHFEWSAKYTLASSYLLSFWASRLPQPAMGIVDRLRWALQQLEPLASDPLGSGLWVTLWTSASLGFVVGRRRSLGLAFALVPASAVLFGVLGLVPLSGRLALWVVPAIYVGLSLFVDRAVCLGVEAIRGHRWGSIAVAGVGLVLVVRLAASEYKNGAPDLLHPVALENKQGLDDRSAVLWLMARRDAGDAMLTTHMAWPAIWWYGKLPLSDPMVAAGNLEDGTGLLEIGYAEGGPGCRRGGLRDALKGHRQALLYLGFRDVPDGYDDLVVDRLSQIGVVSALKQFTGLSLAAVVDLTSRPLPPAISPPTRGKSALKGCVTVQAARLW